MLCTELLNDKVEDVKAEVTDRASISVVVLSAIKFNGRAKSLAWEAYTGR